MVGERNKNVFFIQIDASSFAEFEISEFEISRVDCILFLLHLAGFTTKSTRPKWFYIGYSTDLTS